FCCLIVSNASGLGGCGALDFSLRSNAARPRSISRSTYGACNGCGLRFILSLLVNPLRAHQVLVNLSRHFGNDLATARNEPRTKPHSAPIIVRNVPVRWSFNS